LDDTKYKNPQKGKKGVVKLPGKTQLPESSGKTQNFAFLLRGDFVGLT
jgi:hypothetical protein